VPIGCVRYESTQLRAGREGRKQQQQRCAEFRLERFPEGSSTTGCCSAGCCCSWRPGRQERAQDNDEHHYYLRSRWRPLRFAHRRRCKQLQRQHVPLLLRFQSESDPGRGVVEQDHRCDDQQPHQERDPPNCTSKAMMLRMTTTTN